MRMGDSAAAPRSDRVLKVRLLPVWLGPYQFETDIIKAFLDACGSTSLAMQATNLLLTNQFKISETFRKWLEERSRKYFESLPEYQKHAPMGI